MNNGQPAAREAARDATARDVVRVAAVGDLHCKESSRGTIQPLIQRMADAADVILLCGDLTDHGLPAEAKVLAEELAAVRPPADRPNLPGGRVPMLGVLGNHDFEAGQEAEVARLLTAAGLTLLDGDGVELLGVGFAGAKGFAGGFGRATLSAFGEPGIKVFVKEALDEVMKLEAALLRLRTPHKIAVLHYAPIKATVEGEPPEIFAWLGCSRLEDPINRLGVTACVHGHAHKGAAEGRTAANVPVYNVAVPVMRATYPDRPPFRVLDLPAAAPAAPVAAPTAAPVETTVG